MITSAPAFWGLSDAEKQKLHHVRFEMLVYYYDPFWQLVWGECESAGSFLPVRGEPLPIKAGQRVRIEGVIQPARGILRNEVTVTVLEEQAMPAPRPTQGALADSARLMAQWVALEGFVCQQRQVDPYHAEYLVLSEGWLVSVRVLLTETEPIPQLVNCTARFAGVYIGSLDTNHRLQHIDLWTPRTSDVAVLGELAQDPRFQLPRLPLDQLAAAGTKDWVRVEGEVQEFTPGRELTLRDETGQLAIETPQPGALKAGDRVEVVGRPTGGGLARTLAEAQFRAVPTAATAHRRAGGGGPPRVSLRVIEQIMELSLGEVARGYDVTLRGVVTWSATGADFFYVQDATGGICVRQGPGARAPAIGDSVEVRGLTDPGQYAPEVRRQEVSVMGPISVPPPRLITLEQALTGADEARWVTLRGYVRRVVDAGPWSRLDLTTDSGEYAAYAPAAPELGRLTGAIVAISGVCAAEADTHRRLKKIRLWVPGAEAVEVEAPPPKDPFAAPRYTIAGLNQFSGRSPLNRRVTITGRVVFHQPGRFLLLQDAESGLMAFTRETMPLPPGAAVEISGFPGHDGSRAVLREVVTRATPGGASLVATPCPHPAEIKPEWDARLVQVQALLTEAVGQSPRVRLTLKTDGAFFDALLPAAPGWRPPAPGSLLELSGAYLLEFDEYHRPRGFRLQLRAPSDVRVLATPAWWTTRRAFAVAGGLGLCVLLGLFWVVQLRRLVRAQTRQIRTQLDNEARLQSELERASRLDSLGVLAGGIAHDFNNLLTAIMGNLGLMRLEAEAMQIVGPLVSDAENATKRASDITKQLLTFARGGEPVRSAVDLPEVVREAANFVQHGSNVKIAFDFAPGLPAAEVDAGQISRVIHNLVLNAVQAMTDGGLVRIALGARTLRAGELGTLVAGEYLQLTIADNGPGIPTERLSRIFDPYFTTKATGSGLGLATAHSIVRKHHGHIEVESAPGRGTTFRIWLPGAKGPRPAKATAAGALPVGAVAAVLFMDDEEAVCRVAAAILKNAGHRITVVHDGAAAVEAFDRGWRAGQPFDLVVLDLTVPGGMGGREAVAELRRIDPTVPILACSGYSQDPVMAHFRDYGFSAVLAKPYDPATFIRVINEVRARHG